MPTFGDTSAGASTFPCTGDRAILSLFNLPVAGNVTQINCRFDSTSTAGTSFKGLIYSNNAGVPNALLASSGAVGVPAGGGDLAAALSVSLSAGDYWLGFVCDSFQAVAQTDASPANLSRSESAQGMSYASPPATYTQSGTGTATINVYATYVSGPSISAQPQDSRQPVGGTATFNVTATGNGTLSYQWKFNGTNVGTNSSSYTTSTLTLSDNGTITVDITDLDGTTTSANASLTVYPVGNLAFIYPFFRYSRYNSVAGAGGALAPSVSQLGQGQATENANPVIYSETFPAASGGGTSLNATVQALVLTARTAVVALNRTFDAANQALALTARVAAISRTWTATRQALTLTANAASVALNRTFNAASQALTLTARQATVSLDRSISATRQALTLSTFAATVTGSASGTTISATAQALVLTARVALVSLNRTFNVTVQALTLTPRVATITRTFNTTVQGLTLTARTATITRTFSPNRQALTLTAHQASLANNTTISATRQPLQFTTYGATVTGTPFNPGTGGARLWRLLGIPFGLR